MTLEQATQRRTGRRIRDVIATSVRQTTRTSWDVALRGKDNSLHYLKPRWFDKEFEGRWFTVCLDRDQGVVESYADGEVIAPGVRAQLTGGHCAGHAIVHFGGTSVTGGGAA